MADPSITEIKYLGSGNFDFLEVRVPDDYPDPENLRLVVYDRFHNGSTTDAPKASDIHNVTTDGLLYTEDTDADGNDDDGFLHYTFGTAENGTNIRLHQDDAVGLYNAVTGQTYGLYNWDDVPYTVSTATGDPFAGQVAQQLDATGQIVNQTSLTLQQDGTFTLQTDPEPGISYICFAAGTLIRMPVGACRVEALRIGDVVVTKDDGPQPIRWIGRRRFDRLDPDDGSNHPITIKAHAFGRDIPHRDTTLSPNHAVLNTDWRAPLYFGTEEVLTPAKCLSGSARVRCMPLKAVTYFHILLDRHSLVLANGLWAESLYLGAQCMQMLSPQNRAAIQSALPPAGYGVGHYGPPARQQLSAKEAALVV